MLRLWELAFQERAECFMVYEFTDKCRYYLRAAGFFPVLHHLLEKATQGSQSPLTLSNVHEDVENAMAFNAVGDILEYFLRIRLSIPFVIDVKHYGIVQ